MAYLEYFLYIRAAILWEGRNLPSVRVHSFILRHHAHIYLQYLGPTATQMIFLFIFIVVNSVTLFALAILFARNMWCLGGNVTTIEGWEIERHETLVHRARKAGGYLNGPGGTRVMIQRQEYPYDIGIYANFRQGMGSSPLLWLWPFTSTPSNESGQEFETNGFEGTKPYESLIGADITQSDPSLSWPPPDPDRMSQSRTWPSENSALIRDDQLTSNQDRLDAFRHRQQQDLKRYDFASSNTVRRQKFKDHVSDDGQLSETGYDSAGSSRSLNDENAWRDSEGDRLADFGVDEDVEFYDEDEVPLAELLRKKAS